MLAGRCDNIVFALADQGRLSICLCYHLQDITAVWIFIMTSFPSVVYDCVQGPFCPKVNYPFIVSKTNNLSCAFRPKLNNNYEIGCSPRSKEEVSKLCSKVDSK